MISRMLRVDDDDRMIYTNGKVIGFIYQEVDGYDVAVFYGHGEVCGAWDAHVLREIADILDERNKDWDDQVRRELPLT